MRACSDLALPGTFRGAVRRRRRAAIPLGSRVSSSSRAVNSISRTDAVSLFADGENRNRGTRARESRFPSRALTINF